ncbi:MAG: Crp/Fnr family transcriptional regulator [Prevotella sp.]|nr:Crp/Fnr family transcriptional regulator [Prevotella sp.]
MPSGKIYDRLLSLPLFQGLSYADLSAIVETTRFDFKSYGIGEFITRADTSCTHLYLLMSGEAEVSTQSDDHSYRLSETISGPLLIEPERLFGLTPYYSRSFMARSECRVLSIEKQAVLRLCADHLIVRINLLNIMATLSQRQQRQPWRQAPKTLAERIVRFVEQHALRPAGHKVLHIKMERLAEELNDSRLDISSALHELDRRGLVILSRGVIDFPAFEDCLRNG